MIKEIKKISHYNFKNLLKFEFIFKLLTVIVFSPLFLGIFNFIMKITGYNYLTKENFLNFLLNPLTLIMLIILFIFITIYSLFDIGVIIKLVDCSYQKKEVELKEVVTSSLKKSFQVFHLKNILIIFLVIFLIPFLNMGMGISLISSIKIPEFIMDFIKDNQVLSIMYLLLVTFLITVFLNWIYSLHYYFLENCSFKEAIVKSKNLIKKSHLKDLLEIILNQFLLSIIYVITIIVEIIIIFLINKIFQNISFLNSFLITIIWLFIAVSFIIYAILSSSISYTILSLLFYQHKKEKKEPINHLKISKITKKKPTKNFLTTPLIITVLIVLTFITNLIINGKFNLNIEYIRTMEVTAHRGASSSYPENTMSAFKGAKELGADYIELDVQQTKDNQIIVLHDTNFKRTASINLNTWEATLEDVEKLDVGSFKDEKFAGEKVPLFDDVVRWAKENNMKLNIELKPTGHEENFEKNVADIIKKYHFENNCVVTSQVYEVLENFKKVDEDITTVYVTALAYGDITELNAADFFSVEATSITKSMVSKIHNEGKQIYAWTVNTDDGIKKMIELKVDNIITDDITKAKNIIYASKTSNVITEIIKGIEKIFK